MLDDKSSTFLRSQHDIEMSLGWYSQAFRATLLPGMVVQLCLVNNHSAGLKSLNSLILTEGRFIVLDNLSDLGANICVAMHKNPKLRPRLLWKSDASQGYRQLLMHPCWQIRQATHIDDEYHIDHCAVFGNCALGHLWCLSSGLYAGSPSTNTVLRACFTMLMTLSMCHSVMNSHFTGHMGTSCQPTSVISSTSLTTSESPMRIRNNSMGSHLRSSA